MSLLHPIRPAPAAQDPDAVTLTRAARRRLHDQARTAASAARPGDLAAPAYLTVIDHEAAAAAAGAATEHARQQGARLTVMDAWLRLSPTAPPAPGASGPAARQTAHAHDTWTRATHAAAAALHEHDQARSTLAYTFARIDQTRRTRRALFITTYTTHHPTGAKSSDAGSDHPETGTSSGTGSTQGSYLVPDEHPTATATRTRLHHLHTQHHQHD